MKIAALIVAAGRGTRAGSSAAEPKQYAVLGDKSALAHTVAALASHSAIGHVLIVIHPDDGDLYQNFIHPNGGSGALTSSAAQKLMPPVNGGMTRQLSVLAGLERLADTIQPSHVLIHDAARPFVSPQVISNVVNALTTSAGAVPAMPLTDTLQKTNGDGLILETVPRDNLWRAQTPQGFAFPAILAAHRSASQSGRDDFTDDAALFRWAEGQVMIVNGEEQNFKITTAEDLIKAQSLVAQRSQSMIVRIGNGFDVHRTEPGTGLYLCGVHIPAEFTLVGHSDADVGLHALTDAILGALGDGDIGSHFPPTEPEWKGVASKHFLEHAASRVAQRGGILNNVDVTLICEQPKIGPHREAMRTAIATILNLETGRVSVKATTSEQLGFTGRGEGIAALAMACLTVPV